MPSYPLKVGLSRLCVLLPPIRRTIWTPCINGLPSSLICNAPKRLPGTMINKWCQGRSRCTWLGTLPSTMITWWLSEISQYENNTQSINNRRSMSAEAHHDIRWPACRRINIRRGGQDPTSFQPRNNARHSPRHPSVLAQHAICTSSLSYHFPSHALVKQAHIIKTVWVIPYPRLLNVVNGELFGGTDSALKNLRVDESPPCLDINHFW